MINEYFISINDKIEQVRKMSTISLRFKKVIKIGIFLIYGHFIYLASVNYHFSFAN